MTPQCLWGSLAILTLLIARASATPVPTPPMTVETDSLEYLDPLGELPLTDLFPEAKDSLKDFKKCIRKDRKRADGILQTIANPDLRDYLFAYRDYNETSIPQFVETLSRPKNTHSLAFRMAAVKFLLGYSRKGGTVNVAQIYRSIPYRKPTSSLGYVLNAEDALVCDERGLVLARRVYRDCVDRYPEVPSIRNREAYLYESAAGLLTGKTGTGNNGVGKETVTPSNVQTAIKIRDQILRRFPRYEPNYYYLAGDYKAVMKPSGARDILRDYFKRFGSSGAYYERCKAIEDTLG